MNSEKAVAENERREYFRIKHSLFMSYEILNTEEIQPIDKTAEPKSIPCIYMLKELHKLEEDNNHYLSNLTAEQNFASLYIHQVNQKIEALNQYIIENLDLEYGKRIEVDLSGGGIRFECERELKIDQLLTMELILTPEYHNVLAQGKVVDCKINSASKTFDIAVNFEQIKEVDRDAIIKHIFQTQSKQLRQDKLLR